MAYRFKRSQTVPQNVKRIAREEIGSAIEYLRGKGRLNGDDSIHEVRKNIKKARALLRLVRPEMGDLYAKQNVQLRDAGRKLSDLRDAGALIGVLDTLRKGSRSKPAEQELASVRRLLNRQKRKLEEEARTRKTVPAVRGEMVQAHKSIRRWPLDSDGFSAIEAGLTRTFRDGRKALAQARKSGSREDFHEWRKRVKDLWYQVRLLKKLWGDVMEGYERSLKELEDALGEDLNLAILEERVHSMSPGNGAGRNAASVTKAIDSSREELRKRALEVGQRVYAAKPREFTRQIRRLWKVWRRDSQ